MSCAAEMVPAPGSGEQGMSVLGDEERKLGFQVVGFGAQDLDAPSRRPKGAHGRSMLDAALDIDPQPGATLDLGLEGIPPQLVTELAGAFTMRAWRWQRARVRERTAPSRVQRRTRMASRTPRRRG